MNNNNNHRGNQRHPLPRSAVPREIQAPPFWHTVLQTKVETINRDLSQIQTEHSKLWGREPSHPNATVPLVIQRLEQKAEAARERIEEAQHNIWQIRQDIDGPGHTILGQPCTAQEVHKERLDNHEERITELEKPGNQERPNSVLRVERLYQRFGILDGDYKELKEQITKLKDQVKDQEGRLQRLEANPDDQRIREALANSREVELHLAALKQEFDSHKTLTRFQLACQNLVIGAHDRELDHLSEGRTDRATQTSNQADHGSSSSSPPTTRVGTPEALLVQLPISIQDLSQYPIIVQQPSNGDTSGRSETSGSD